MLKSILSVFLIIVLFSSCANSKKMIYFQETVPSEATKEMNYSPVLKKDDLLSIAVSSSSIEASTPFNIQVPQTGASSGGSGGGQQGYLIDENGDINFPFLGKIQLLGMTRSQAITMMEEKLRPYLDKPIVQIRILNFKITLLGDISKPGNYLITNERITLLEALGLGGDLSITGKRRNVKVIRDRNGKRTEYLIDLTKSDLFNSDVYYLEQNDIVYIEPNQTKLVSSVLNPAIGLIFSVTTLVITSLSILTR
jgi:polysaccharide export outer membrane protein